MKKLIVIYSKTGNTRGVALKLQEALKADLEEIKAVSDDPNQTFVELKEVPKMDGYQEITIGTPVHGFMLPKVTKAYFDEFDDFSQKTFDLFVTHFFPFAWLGGNQTLKKMKKIIESKHGIVKSMHSINWKSKKRESSISQMINQLSHEEKI